MEPKNDVSVEITQKFEVKIADKKSVHEVSFQSSSKRGNIMLECLCDLAASGPKLPFGEIAENGKDSLSVTIRGYDKNSNKVFSALMFRINNGSVALRVLKCSNDSKALQNFMFIVSRAKLNMIVTEPRTVKGQ
jgi:hypothetical protein